MGKDIEWMYIIHVQIYISSVWDIVPHTVYNVWKWHFSLAVLFNICTYNKQSFLVTVVWRIIRLGYWQYLFFKWDNVPKSHEKSKSIVWHQIVTIIQHHAEHTIVVITQPLTWHTVFMIRQPLTWHSCHDKPTSCMTLNCRSNSTSWMTYNYHDDSNSCITRMVMICNSNYCIKHNSYDFSFFDGLDALTVDNYTVLRGHQSWHLVGRRQIYPAIKKRIRRNICWGKKTLQNEKHLCWAWKQMFS